MKTIDPKKWLCLPVDAIGAGAAVALTLLVYFAGFSPLLTHRVDVAAKRGELDAQRQKSSDRQSSAAVLRARLAEVEEALTKTQVRLQPATHVNQRIAQITGLANDSRLKVDDIQLGRSEGTSRSTSIPISMAGSGTYETCTAFLHRLNAALPDTSVTVLDLSGSPTGQEAAATFRLDLLWYAAPASGAEAE